MATRRGNTPRPIAVPGSMLTRLLRLARTTAEQLEAGKHRDQRRLIEVQLLLQVEHVEAFIATGGRSG